MEEHKVIKITHRWLIAITLFFILILIGLVRYIIFKNTLFNKKFIYNTETAYKQEAEHNNQTKELIQQNQIRSYSANIIIQPEKEKEYKIGDGFFIKVKILNINDDIVNYSFSINDSEYFHNDNIKISEGDESFGITVYKMGKYFIFENTGKIDARDTHIYIFDEFGKSYKDLYKIGDKADNELYIESIKFTENEFIINTSRITEDFQIIYDGSLYNIDDEEISIVPDETPVKIQYKYVANGSGNVDFANPEKKVLDTWGDFIKRNN